MKVWLLDTGPIVACLDADDPAHDRVLEAFDSFRGQLITTGAVVTEAMHFATKRPEGPEILVEFLEAASVKIVECCRADDLKRTALLMKKYAETPMDFADATLVLLSDELNVHIICTLDRRGFATYRSTSGKRFNLVIDRS